MVIVKLRHNAIENLDYHDMVSRDGLERSMSHWDTEKCWCVTFEYFQKLKLANDVEQFVVQFEDELKAN